MKVLILGGAGFIGYHLARSLSASSDRVTVCDNLSRGKMDNEFSSLCKKGNVRFITADLTLDKGFQELERDYDCVYHLAAINGTRYFYEIPDRVLKTNILVVLNFLEWLVKIKYQAKLVWLSSSEAYAGGYNLTNMPIPTPETVPLIIEDVFNPRFSYAGSKIAGELLCINYAKQHRFSLSIVRPHNIYGPRMHEEHVIPELILRIIKKQNPFKLYGGQQSRSFCYIDDFIKGITLVAGSGKSKGEIINIGNDEEITIQDLAKKMFDLFGFHPQIESLPAPQGSVARRCPDINKARGLLGYAPEVELEEGLKRTYEWYL